MKNITKKEQDVFPFVTWSGNIGYLEVRVSPGAPKTEIQGRMDNGTLKLRIHAKAENGKANDELVLFLQKNLNTKRVEILSGASSRTKLIRIFREN